MDTPVLNGQQKPTFIKLCIDTGCRLEEFPRVMPNRYRWQEIVKGET